MSNIDDVCFNERMQDSCTDVVKTLRDVIRRDVEERDNEILFLHKYRIYSIIIPNFIDIPDLDNVYLDRYIDKSMLEDLESAQALNWCRTAERLYPIKTTSDGNCLLHALSQSLWGTEDSEQFLRRLLYLNVVTDPREAFKRRWIFHQRHNSDLSRVDVRLDTVEINTEWETVIKATDDLTGSHAGDLPYTALESIHLFVSANMLKRPIIVVADSMARNVFGQTLQENQIEGIYLPLEWKPDQCNKNPLILGYNLNHFCPLVLKEKLKHRKSDELLRAIPIITKDLNSIPARYLLPQEEHEYITIINSYLNMTEVLHNMTPIPAAKINNVPLPNDLNVVDANKRDCLLKWRRMTGEIRVHENQPPPETPQRQLAARNRTSSPRRERAEVQGPVPIARARCVTIGCGKYANPGLQGLCSKCFNDFTVEYAKQEAAARNYNPLPGRNILPDQRHGNTERHRSYHDLSMMGEDCQAGCGFKCSVETFPYCHECYPKFTQPETHPEPPSQVPNISMMPDECRNPACTFKCSKATYPYCHNCFNTVGQAQTAIPSAPPPSVPFSQINVEAQPMVAPTAIASAPPLSVQLQQIGAVHQPMKMNIPLPTQNGTGCEPMDVIQGTGALNRKCCNGNCEQAAIKGNNGYCNSCYERAMYSETLGTQCSSPGKADITQCTCITPGCCEPIASGLTHCTQCFLRGDITTVQPVSLTGATIGLNIQPSLNIPCQPQLIQKSNTSIPIEHEETNPYQPNHETKVVTLQQEEEMAIQKKFLCSKPGCKGFRGVNDEGLCDDCWNQQGMGETQDHQVSDLENSRPYISCNQIHLSDEEMKKLNPIVKSSRDKVNCASPTCKAMIYPPKRLCDECSAVLQKHQATKSMEINLKSVGVKGIKCKTEGCQFFGVPETNGFCSSCHKSLVNMTRHSIPIAQKSSMNSNTAPLVNKPVNIPKTPNTPLVGNYCIHPGCTRFGDPLQRDRCSQHFEMMSAPIMSQDSLQEQRNIIALQKQGYRINSDKYNVAGSNYPVQSTQAPGQIHNGTYTRNDTTPLNLGNSSEGNETFEDVYGKLLKSKVTHRHCVNKNKGCMNFENPANNGYCNECYRQSRHIQTR
ncbi:negative regulation of toll-like receptor 5 signaling pathway [Mactra antiquata]